MMLTESLLCTRDFCNTADGRKIIDIKEYSPMKKYMELPAEYTVLSEDEMTYTSGGSDVLGAAITVAGVAVLASSYVWGISQARDWLSVSSNRKGNVFTIVGRASDDIAKDMSKSASNCLRDAVSTATVVALAPLSAILILL